MLLTSLHTGSKRQHIGIPGRQSMTASGLLAYFEMWWPFLGSIVAMVVVAAASSKSRRDHASLQDGLTPSQREYGRSRGAALQQIARIDGYLGHLGEHQHSLRPDQSGSTSSGKGPGEEEAQHRTLLEDVLMRLQATPSVPEAARLTQHQLLVEQAAINQCALELVSLERSVRKSRPNWV